jgi:hypothetical protein
MANWISNWIPNVRLSNDVSHFNTFYLTYKLPISNAYSFPSHKHPNINTDGITPTPTTLTPSSHISIVR